MGFIDATTEALERLDSQVRAIQRKLGIDSRGLAAEEGADSGLPSAVSSFLTHASQEDFAYVVITGGPVTTGGGDGYFTARRQMATPSRTVIDDDELVDALKVYPAAGATPFIGAAGFVRYSGLIGTPAEALWLTAAGEWNGFLAKLTDTPDANEAYAWTQVGAAAFRTPLSNLTGGSTPLGRCWDYSYRSRDAGITSRNNWTANTVVALRFDPVDRRMFFSGRREPVTDLC